jgi:uncharacterized membrane protein YozB (DUF420 family)
MKFDVMILPAINATLNSIATVLLLYGYYLIKQKRRLEHRKVMIAAFAVSVLFLVCYITYHTIQRGVSTPFGGSGAIAVFYYTILISHIALAAIVPVLAIITMRRGLANRFDKHRKIARWTFPIWLYVSVTGVIVYFMLYQWFPAARTAAIP